MTPQTILLAEDDPSLRGLIGRMLAAAGYVVLEARNGGEALDRCRQQGLDLVITDVSMPHVDGVSVVEHLAAQPSAPPVLVMSARPLDERLPPHTNFLRKPFTRDELLERVRGLTVRRTSCEP